VERALKCDWILFCAENAFEPGPSRGSKTDKEEIAGHPYATSELARSQVLVKEVKGLEQTVTLTSEDIHRFVSQATH